ncbi:hypothetical protein CYY_008591 [Polysphondylium violaceum]|uniref:Sodium/hydrogen exchanger n=1 Tax=Polysphondylium violaceum TaxID=133409 RepID=A0A8J4V144_9MYCE|nr:hypothetical protein CYY_008591 [Polysphondylium violaceum]
MGIFDQIPTKPIFVLIILLSHHVIVNTTTPITLSDDENDYSTLIKDNDIDNDNDQEAIVHCDSSLGCGSDASRLILLFIIVLFFSVMVVYFISSLNIHYLPDSVCLVIYGVIVGVIGRLSHSQLIEHVSSFDPDKFFLFLLPIIIFETGFSLPKTHFLRNLPSILILAIFGTVIAFAFTGIGIYLLGTLNISRQIQIKEALLIGAIGSAIDPVSTIAIFKALDVDPILYMIVLGESVLNDGVSVIIFQSVLSYSLTEIWKPILFFFALSIGSVAIGIITSLLLALLLKHFNISKYPPLETIFMIMFSYISYLVSDSIGLSGILSSFFSGMTMSHYSLQNLTQETKHTITQLYKTGAFIGETIAFIYIGISLPIHEFHVSVPLILFTIILFMVSRAIAIYPTFFICNRFKIQPYVSKSIQFVIWFSGLRGAISFSLSLSESLNGYPSAPYIRTTILILVYFSLITFGLGTYPLLKFLKISTNTSMVQTLDTSMSKEYEQEQTKHTYLGSFMKRLEYKLSLIFSRAHAPQETIKGDDNDNDQENNYFIHEYDNSAQQPDNHIEMESYYDTNNINGSSDDNNSNDDSTGGDAILLVPKETEFESSSNSIRFPGKNHNMIKSHSTSSLIKLK